MGEVVRRLAEDPELLERCARELAGGPDRLTLESLASLPTCTNVVREAKRIVPLVPLAFGRARRSFRCGGYDVPAGWTVYLALHLNNHDAVSSTCRTCSIRIGSRPPGPRTNGIRWRSSRRERLLRRSTSASVCGTPP